MKTVMVLDGEPLVTLTKKGYYQMGCLYQRRTLRGRNHTTLDSQSELVSYVFSVL